MKREVDYREYSFTVKEKMLYLCIGLLVIGVIAYTFYHSVWAFVLLLPLVIPYLKFKKKQRKQNRQWELLLQFREAIGFVSSNLQSGYSVENAFRSAYADLCRMYGEGADISREWFLLKTALDSNRVLEEILLSFSKRTGVKDIGDFAEVFAIGKRNGCDFEKMVASGSKTIREKTDVKREVKVLVSEKEFEFKIMSVIPVCMIIYIGFTSPGYFNSMYHNLGGVACMSLCLAIYALAIYLGIRIIHAESEIDS